MNYKKMLQEIDELVNNDFCMNMEMKTIPNSSEYTQEEAKEMAELLASVYSTSHCLHCKNCGRKYLKR